jgi:hypothetical protein
MVGVGVSGVGLGCPEGRWEPGVLVIGDGDSLVERKTVVALGR